MFPCRRAAARPRSLIRTRTGQAIVLTLALCLSASALAQQFLELRDAITGIGLDGELVLAPASSTRPLPAGQIDQLLTASQKTGSMQISGRAAVRVEGYHSAQMVFALIRACRPVKGGSRSSDLSTAPRWPWSYLSTSPGSRR